MRYRIVIKRCSNKAKSHGALFRRPVHVRIMDLYVTEVDAETNSPWHVRRGEGDIIHEWRNVDSRYSGPRSAYGQALAAAEETLAQLEGVPA